MCVQAPPNLPLRQKTSDPLLIALRDVIDGIILEPVPERLKAVLDLPGVDTQPCSSAGCKNGKAF